MIPIRVMLLAIGVSLPVVLAAQTGVAAPGTGASRSSTASPDWIPPPSLVAKAGFILDDNTGKMLYGYHADMPRYPASTIKMMTAVVVLKRLGLNTIVTVPASAMIGGTTARLVPGERMSVRNLLYGMLLPSGNDAAITLAVAVSGSPRTFAVLMNAEARRLHLWHSRFLGATGLDGAGQYSTARDLAWLGRAVLKNAFLARIVRTQSYRAISTDGRFWHTWTNLNRLLWSYPGVIGVKTGTTPGAGANLVACSQRKGHRIIAVIMGSTVASRYKDATRLLNYGWRLVGR